MLNSVESMITASSAGLSGAMLTRLIAQITGFDLFEKAREVNTFPFFFQLLITSFGANLCTCSEKYLEFCIRKNHGSHIPAVRHQPRGLAESVVAVRSMPP